MRSGESSLTADSELNSQHTSASLTVNENYDRGTFKKGSKSMHFLIFHFSMQDVRKGIAVFNVI